MEGGRSRIENAQMPAARPGITPTGYQYREYKNWRGIPKPRRCPFCKRAKGEIRKARGGFLGVCPNSRATGPKRESRDEALRAWNGKMPAPSGAAPASGESPRMYGERPFKNTGTPEFIGRSSSGVSGPGSPPRSQLSK